MLRKVVGISLIAIPITAVLVIFCLAANPWWMPLAVAGGLFLIAGLIAAGIEILEHE